MDGVGERGVRHAGGAIDVNVSPRLSTSRIIVPQCRRSGLYIVDRGFTMAQTICQRYEATAAIITIVVSTLLYVVAAAHTYIYIYIDRVFVGSAIMCERYKVPAGITVSPPLLKSDKQLHSIDRAAL